MRDRERRRKRERKRGRENILNIQTLARRKRENGIFNRKIPFKVIISHEAAYIKRQFAALLKRDREKGSQVDDV